MRWIAVLLLLAAIVRADHARDIPTRENFQKLLDALATGIENNLANLEVAKRHSPPRPIRPDFGLAADPKGMRYQIYGGGRMLGGGTAPAYASFCFWAVQGPNDEQFAAAAREFAWMAELVRARFEGWKLAEKSGDRSRSCAMDSRDGRGYLTLVLGVSVGEGAPDGYMWLGLNLGAGQRPGSNWRNELAPGLLVRALENAAYKKWNEMRWKGDGLIGPDALHANDIILKFGDTLVGRRDAETTAEAIHDHILLKTTPLEFTVRRGEVRTISFRVKPNWGKYDGPMKDNVPTGPGRRTLPSGTLLIARFENGWPDGPGVAIGGNGRVWRTYYRKGAPGRTESLPMWKGRTLDGYEYGPITLARGKVVERNDNLVTLRIDGLGTYRGFFADGVAQGEGLVTRPNGNLLKVDCLHGIMSVVQVLKAVAGDRMALYQERNKGIKGKIFRRGELLSGDARDGEGVLFYGWGWLYRGGIRNGKPHGRGRFVSDDGSFTEGTWKDGLRHGRMRTVSYHGGMQVGDSTDTYKEGKYVVPPGKPAPKRRKRSAPRRFTECWTCNMRGYVHVTTTTVEGVTISPFMPGDRHYGSWIWKGYADTSKARTVKHTQRVTCRACGGTGRRN